VFARALPLLPLVLGAALMAAAEPMRLRSIVANGRTVESVTAGAHHGWALAVLAVALLGLAWPLLARPTRASRIAVVVVALAALWVVLGIDLPALDDTGLVGGRLASASTGPAFRFELVGVVLALIGAVACAVASERRH
jgi:hypothetical protein